MPTRNSGALEKEVIYLEPSTSSVGSGEEMLRACHAPKDTQPYRIPSSLKLTVAVSVTTT